MSQASKSVILYVFLSNFSLGLKLVNHQENAGDLKTFVERAVNGKASQKELDMFIQKVSNFQGADPFLSMSFNPAECDIDGDPFKMAPTFQGHKDESAKYGTICSYITTDHTQCHMGFVDECEDARKKQLLKTATSLEHVGVHVHFGQSCCQLDSGFCEESCANPRGEMCDTSSDSHMVMMGNRANPKHWLNPTAYTMCHLMDLTPTERTQITLDPKTGRMKLPDLSGCKGFMEANTGQHTWDYVEKTYGPLARWASGKKTANSCPPPMPRPGRGKGR